MDIQLLNKYEEIIKAFSSKFFFRKMKEDWILWPKIIFSFKGSILIFIGLWIDTFIGWILALFGIPFLFFGREFLEDMQEHRKELFKEIWDKGHNEWIKMLNYLMLQHAIELVIKRIPIGKGSLAGAIGVFAVGQLFGYIGSKNDEINWNVTQYLLIIWVIIFLIAEIKKTFWSSQKDNIEMALKAAKKFERVQSSPLQRTSNI